jgi:hypothetical protein
MYAALLTCLLTVLFSYARAQVYYSGNNRAAIQSYTPVNRQLPASNAKTMQPFYVNEPAVAYTNKNGAVYPMAGNMADVPAAQQTKTEIQLKPAYTAADGLKELFSHPIRINLGNASVFVSKRGIGLKFYILRPFR